MKQEQQYYRDVITKYLNSDEVTQEQRDAFIEECKLAKHLATDYIDKSDYDRDCLALLKAGIFNTDAEIKCFLHGTSLKPIQPKYKPTVGFDPLTNVEEFYKVVPFFYDKSKMFWLWDNVYKKYNIVDEVDIMNLIEKELGLYGQTVRTNVKNEYLECFKRIGRKHIPEEAPTKWIQFKDKAISLNSGKIYEVTPDYFFTNPIPFELGTSEDTPTMDKLFKEWVGENYVQDLYEIIAYCCYRDYPIQVMNCLYGSGRNGKSQYLKILYKFLGTCNICSTELDLLAGHNSSRFETFKLYKKLCCLLGETNFGILTSTSMLKKLVGGDVIGFEKKGKDPFDDYNYAKIIIASNSLPSTDDTSDGFMRRWHIIDFPNEFPEGKDIVNTIPDIEYNNLAKKIFSLLKNMLDKGRFNNLGSIKVRKEKYMMASNPLPIFIKNFCEVKHDGYILYNKLFTAYVQFLLQNKKRRVKMKEFKTSLENEGFYIDRSNKKIDGEFVTGYYVEGLSLCDNYDNYDHFSNSFSICKIKCKNMHNCHKSHKIEDFSENNNTNIQKDILEIEEEKVGQIPTKYNKYDKCYISCSICGKTDENYLANDNKSYCKDCLKAKEVNSN